MMSRGYCAVMTFSLLFWENSGVVRGYVIACVFLAMAAYDRIVSRNVFVLLKKTGRWIKMKIIHIRARREVRNYEEEPKQKE